MSEHVLEHLSAYLDGALGAAEKERFRAHLTECSACAKRLEDLTAVDAALRDLPAGAPPNYFEDLPARLRSRLAASAAPRRRLWRVPVWGLAAAAALLVAVVAPLTLTSRHTPTAPEALPARLSDQPPIPAAEADKLSRAAQTTEEVRRAETPKRDDRRAPAALAPPPVPAATAAPAEDFRQKTNTKGRAFETKKVEAAPAAPPPQQRPSAAPAAGFAEPPQLAAQTAQQAGPRASQQAEPRKQGPMKGVEAQTETGAAAGNANRTMEGKDAAATAERALAKSDKETPRGRAAGLMAVSRPQSARFRELLARAPRDAAEARSLCEAWRSLAAETADLVEADEARVHVIEMGLRAWRFERQEADLSSAERDAAAYLARDDARQRTRVRNLLAAQGR